MGLPINEPRVPEPHAEVSIEDEKLLSDLYIRTSWFDAALALDQIEKVNWIYALLSHQRKFLSKFLVLLCFRLRESETMNY